MSISILHISDTHVYADKDKPLPSTVLPYHSLKAVLDAAAAFYIQRGTGPAILLHTGDLTHDDVVESYTHVAQLMSDFCAQLSAAGFVPPRVVYCEGNHGDVSVCDKVFRDKFKFTGVSASGTPENGRRPLVLDIGKHWQMAVVSSHVPDQIYGNVSNSDLAFLKKFVTSKSSNNNNKDDGTSCGDAAAGSRKHKIIALHHPPIHPLVNLGPNDGSSWAEMCLRDPSRAEMRNIVYGPGNDDLAMVLHGHLHIDGVMFPPAVFKQQQQHPQPQQLQPWNTFPAVRGKRVPAQLGAPSTCHQADALSWSAKSPAFLKHGCRIIDLNDDGTWTHFALWAKEKKLVSRL